MFAPVARVEGNKDGIQVRRVDVPEQDGHELRRGPQWNGPTQFTKPPSLGFQALIALVQPI
jgi:hypothetical protein